MCKWHLLLSQWIHTIVTNWHNLTSMVDWIPHLTFNLNVVTTNLNHRFGSFCLLLHIDLCFYLKFFLMAIFQKINKSKLFYLTTPIFYVNAGNFHSTFQIISIFFYFFLFQHHISDIYIQLALLIVFFVMKNYEIGLQSYCSVLEPMSMAQKSNKQPVYIIKIQSNTVIKLRNATKHFLQKLI